MCHLVEYCLTRWSSTSHIDEQIHHRKTPNFKGYSPLLSGNNDPNGAGDLHEGFEFGWENPITDKDNEEDEVDPSGVMAGANVWPSEADVPGFREKVLRY